MNPIETLMREHRLIEKVLTALESYVEGIRERPAADEKTTLLRFVSFIRDFADRCHHGKEEDILFAAMVASGFPRESGPIAVMLHEHDEGRELVRSLDEHGRRAAPWTAEDRRRITDAACAFAGMLRQHIQKEDGILYPMAEARLPGSALENVARRFETFEQERTGAGEHERLHQLAESLITQHSHPGNALR